MTSTPTTILVVDAVEAYNEVAPTATATLVALERIVASVGSEELSAAMDAHHASLKALDDAFLGLLPNDASKPQPQDGGQPKPPSN